MGKVPSIVILIVGIVLILGVSAGAFFKMIKPQTQALASVHSEVQKEQEVGAQLDDAQKELLQVTKKWKLLQKKLKDAQASRGIDVSFAQPVVAWIALWPEYRQALPDAITEFIESSGCTITSGASMPAPPSVPPSPPASGFMQIPQGQQISLTVQGTLEEIEELYLSLRKFERVATISGLSLTGQGDIITAQLPLTIYVLTEVPKGAAPVPAAGYGMAGPGYPGGPLAYPGAPGAGYGMAGPGYPGGPPGYPGAPGGGPPGRPAGVPAGAPGGGQRPRS